MALMVKDELEKLIKENENLKIYIEKYNKNIKPRVNKPLTFYKKLPLI